MNRAPRLYVITDRRQARNLLSAAESAAEAGAPALQLREKDLDAASLYELAVELRKLLERHRTALYNNDRADVAAAAGAGGVQVRADSLAPREVRACFPQLAIGCSVHGLAEALKACESGADFLVFGPIFATPSKQAYGPPQGLAALAAVCRAATLPVLAVGGITPERVAEVLEQGAHGVAAIGAIWAEPDDSSGRGRGSARSAPMAGRAVERFLEALAESSRA